MTDPLRFSRAEARFEHADRYDRGSRYNDRHLADVEIVQDGVNRFAVRFPDSDEGHVVDLEATPEGYQGTCTCPDFEFRSTVCKHMWAVFADPDSPVVDESDGRTPPARRAMTDGGTAVATTSTTSNGRAPSYGDLVEQAVAEYVALELIDAPFYDARATKKTPGPIEPGTPIQIKGAQERIKNGTDRNGNQKYTAGRLTIWREELLHLLMDGGRYVVAVYADDRDPSDPGFIDKFRVLTPDQIETAVQSNDADADPWHDAHRPSKGERAKLAWKKVLGADPDV
ncbi:PD-(DE)xK superfamily endonuclease [Halanaeroarchaeum sp. HSR-CO]|uniref:SWIM zinc finger family protein n=1 Tax=Halanaeroarchaeum sp. HSR-CO TaxID=2866382 RepID=UPI00217EAF01|nr:SWIM zinc finger family protein [Halanaeroarchaeum sp. HSR-CO]UWG46563.1 PD-(DE)xK superfamily endonuclease [Halanaeroarchaeum sp. HSR-CO]